MFGKSETVSVPGSPTKPNEDRVGVTETIVFVIDGATGKTDKTFVAKEGTSDAAWLAELTKSFFLTEFDPTADIVSEFRRCGRKLHEAFTDNTRQLPKHAWEYPSASAIVAVRQRDFIVLGSLGDCTALILMKNGSVLIFGGDPVQQELDSRVISLAVNRSLGHTLPLSEKRKLVLQEIQLNQLEINVRGGYGALSVAFPDPKDNVRLMSAPVEQVDAILLMSDGFYAIVEDYKKYSAHRLAAQCTSDSLLSIVNEARKIEDADPEGLKYPRLKKSDDASAAYVQLRP